MNSDSRPRSHCGTSAGDAFVSGRLALIAKQNLLPWVASATFCVVGVKMRELRKEKYWECR
jgi:hypothetical protein